MHISFPSTHFYLFRKYFKLVMVDICMIWSRHKIVSPHPKRALGDSGKIRTALHLVIITTVVFIKWITHKIVGWLTVLGLSDTRKVPPPRKRHMCDSSLKNLRKFSIIYFATSIIFRSHVIFCWRQSDVIDDAYSNGPIRSRSSPPKKKACFENISHKD